jgi:hypothetical protein
MQLLAGQIIDGKYRIIDKIVTRRPCRPCRADGSRRRPSP